MLLQDHSPLCPGPGPHNLPEVDGALWNQGQRVQLQMELRAAAVRTFTKGQGVLSVGTRGPRETLAVGAVHFKDEGGGTEKSGSLIHPWAEQPVRGKGGT